MVLQGGICFGVEEANKCFGHKLNGYHFVCSTQLKICLSNKVSVYGVDGVYVPGMSVYGVDGVYVPGMSGYGVVGVYVPGMSGYGVVGVYVPGMSVYGVVGVYVPGMSGYGMVGVYVPGMSGYGMVVYVCLVCRDMGWLVSNHACIVMNTICTCSPPISF